MNIASFVDIRRTLLPCTGVGRHANGVLLALAARDDTEVTLLVGADQTDAEGYLPANAPLRMLPSVKAVRSARRTEQLAKATGFPLLDRSMPAGTDWIYCPHDTLITSRKAPVAITIHDARLFEPGLRARNPQARARNAVMCSWMRRSADAARIVFTVSEFSRARLVELMRLDPNKVVAVGNGLENHIFTAAKSGEVDRARLNRIVAVGGLRRVKGGDVILSVAEHLAAMGATTEILSVGGPDEPDLVKRAACLPNVIRAGVLSDEALSDAIAHATALLFPSRYEGFGMPPIEAMALGTPVITTRTSSLPEIVGDGAVLIEPDDVDGAVAAFERIHHDTHWRVALVERGRAVANRYTWDCVADRVFTALQAAC